MIKFINLLEDNYNTGELFDKAKALYNTYDLFMFDEKIWNAIEAVFQELPQTKLDSFKKEILGHKIVNEVVYRYYPGEMPVKYSFIKDLVDNNDEITLFEMYAASSRVDIARINGKSFAYEIKTELDKLSKLKKQIGDYLRVFEFVYVITVPEYLEKVEDIVPGNCGIYIYKKSSNNGFEFKKEKHAKYNLNIDQTAQINCFSSKDLEEILLNNNFNRKEIPSRKAQRKELILTEFSKEEIKEIFKLAVKRKYQTKWFHVKKVFDNILPLDVQAFFKSKADPDLVYYKNSLSV